MINRSFCILAISCFVLVGPVVSEEFEPCSGKVEELGVCTEGRPCKLRHIVDEVYSCDRGAIEAWFVYVCQSEFAVEADNCVSTTTSQMCGMFSGCKKVEDENGVTECVINSDDPDNYGIYSLIPEVGGACLVGG